ncbi:ABC transporter permease [Patescibacteria group bacterium]|nr:ABC transporter permease [Patescibacteria group bacterium]
MLLVSEIKTLSHHKNLLWQMVSREVKARYKQSILGYFWVILNPLAQMLVMSFAFSLIMRIPTAAKTNIPYSIFLFTALLPWTLFSTSLSSASNSLVINSSLITKVYFPRIILVLATIVAKIIDYLFASTILIVYLAIYKIPISLNILWIIPIFLIQQIFTLGLSLFLSAANLMYRDIQYLLGLVLMLWMYLTPVIYPVDMVPAQFRFIYQLNPMSIIINAYRQSILSGSPPKFSSLIIAFFVSFAVLLLGLRYFKNQEKTFADNV